MRWKVRSFLAALMALGTLSILATQMHVKPAAAVAFGADDRHAVARTKGTEGGAIGLVFYQAASGQFAAGTGFLVSPCHVLTAYHVAAGGERVDETTTSTFYVGDGKIGPDFPDLNRFAESSPAHAVLWGRYVRLNEESNLLVRAQSVERNGWEDWALLELDKCFGGKPYNYGYLKLAPVSTREIMKSGANIAARSVGLPGDKSARSLWEDPTCRLIGQIYASGWQHDCITIPGNSGGPILIKDPVTGEDRVAAITVSHIAVEGLTVDASDALVLKRDDPNYYDYLAIAVPVAGLIERIAPYLGGMRGCSPSSAGRRPTITTAPAIRSRRSPISPPRSRPIRSSPSSTCCARSGTAMPAATTMRGSTWRRRWRSTGISRRRATCAAAWNWRKAMSRA